jgi:hypothetical protein
MAHWFWFWSGSAATPVTATFSASLAAVTASGSASFAAAAASVGTSSVTIGSATVSASVSSVAPVASIGSLMAGSSHDPFVGNTGDALETYSTLWTKHPGYTSGSLAITSTDRTRVNNANTAGYLWGVEPGSANQVVSAKFVRLSSLAANEQVYLAARMDPAADTMYLAGYDNSGQWSVRKRVAGVGTTLGTSSATLTQDQLYGVEFRLSGSSLSLYVDGSLVIGPITDTSISAANQLGLRVNRSTGANDTSGVHIDDFTATAPHNVLPVAVSGAATFTSGGPSVATSAVTLASDLVSATAAFVAATPSAGTLSQSIAATTLSGSVAFVTAGSRSATFSQSLASVTVAGVVSSAAPGSTAATLSQSSGTVTLAAGLSILLSGTGAVLVVSLDDFDAGGTVTRTLASSSVVTAAITLAAVQVAARGSTMLLVGPTRFWSTAYRDGIDPLSSTAEPD